MNGFAKAGRIVPVLWILAGVPFAGCTPDDPGATAWTQNVHQAASLSRAPAVTGFRGCSPETR